MTLTNEVIEDREWTVESFTDSSKAYLVKRFERGGQQLMGCSCPAWKFNHSGDRTCKHTAAVLEHIRLQELHGRDIMSKYNKVIIKENEFIVQEVEKSRVELLSELGDTF